MGLGDSTLVVHVFLHPGTYLLLVGSTGGWHKLAGILIVT